ncbi:unnamed protein product [Parajaminaea phylloscopi]
MIRSSSFGPSSSQPPAKQPFSFGGATSTQQPSASTSTGTFSFGNTASTSSSAANPAPAATATSLFGAKPAAPSASAGFSFGQNSANQQQQQPGSSSTAPATGSGLFGNLGSQPSQNPGATNPSSGLFGASSSQPQQQQQPPSSGSLFGNTGGGLGASASLFGRSQPAAPQSSSSFALGQNQPQQQQQSPFSRHPYYQKERFNDLPEDARNVLDEMNKMIQSQISIRDQIQPKLIPSASSATGLAELGSQVHQLYSSLHSASLALSSLEASIDHELTHVRKLVSTVESDRQDFAVLWELGGNYRNAVTTNMGNGSTSGPSGPSQGLAASSSMSLSSHSGEKYREFLRSYFLRAAQDFSSRIILYRDTLGSVSRHLSSLSSRDVHSPQAIRDTIFFQHSHFMNLASQVATLHSDVETLKRDYRSWYARQFRSARDPFENIGEDIGASL